MATPRTSTTSAPSVDVSTLATALKAQLEASSSSTVYVPLDNGDVPSDAELAALVGEGLHAELDAVRPALAVRAATEDEMAQAADAAAASTPATTSSSSSSTTSSTT